MSKIINIGVLDIRNIKEDLAKEISVLANIGTLIESDESQILLKDSKKTNIGSNIKVPKEVEVIVQNGHIKLDKDYLEGLINPIVIILNGTLIFREDIDSNLIKEKIYSIIVNGRILSPKGIIGIIQSKGSVNGELVGYNRGYTLIYETIKMSNKFLNSLKANTKLAFNKLFIIEDIDYKLFQEKISNIQILSRLIITENHEKVLSQHIDDYYSINKTLIPTGSSYIEDDIYVDHISIKKYKDSVLYVNGEVEIDLEEDIVIKEYIKSLICKKVICREKDIENIMEVLGNNDIEIEIIKGKSIRNEGKMVLSGKLEDLKEGISIINSGKLIFDESLNYSEFNKKVLSIINHGLIVVSEEKMGIIKSKVSKNFGLIKSLEDKERTDKDNENIIYANMGELKL